MFGFLHPKPVNMKMLNLDLLTFLATNNLNDQISSTTIFNLILCLLLTRKQTQSKTENRGICRVILMCRRLFPPMNLRLQFFKVQSNSRWWPRGNGGERKRMPKVGKKRIYILIMGSFILFYFVLWSNTWNMLLCNLHISLQIRIVCNPLRILGYCSIGHIIGVHYNCWGWI